MRLDEIDIFDIIKEIPSKLIFADPNKINKTDSLSTIDCKNKELLTFDSYMNLLISHRRRNKDFIIAKVVTKSSDALPGFFEFYYSANDFNKELFRLDSTSNILYKMQIKNPTNNLEIYGDVLYYKITRKCFDDTIVKYFFTKKSIDKIRKNLNEYQISNENKMNVKLKDIYQYIFNQILLGNVYLPTEQLKKNETLCFKAEYFANDQDFALNRNIRNYFKHNLLYENDIFLYENDGVSEDAVLFDSEFTILEPEIFSWTDIIIINLVIIFIIIFVTEFLDIAFSSKLFLILMFIIIQSIILLITYILSMNYTFPLTTANNTNHYLVESNFLLL